VYGPIYCEIPFTLGGGSGPGVVPLPFASLVGPAARGALRVAAAAALVIIRLSSSGSTGVCLAP